MTPGRLRWLSESLRVAPIALAFACGRPVVLSNNGQPKLLQVTEGPEVATPLVPRLTRIAGALVEWKGKPRQALTFVAWAKDGRSVESQAACIFVDGHFAQLIAGE